MGAIHECRGTWRNLRQASARPVSCRHGSASLSRHSGWLRTLWIYAHATGGATWFAVGIGLLVVVAAAANRPATDLVLAALPCSGRSPPRSTTAPGDLGPWLLVGAACLALVPLPRQCACPTRILTAGLVVLRSALWAALFTLASRQHDAPFLAPSSTPPSCHRRGARRCPMHMLTTADSIR
jgi:hypothetical protein